MSLLQHLQEEAQFYEYLTYRLKFLRIRIIHMKHEIFCISGQFMLFSRSLQSLEMSLRMVLNWKGFNSTGKEDGR